MTSCWLIVDFVGGCPFQTTFNSFLPPYALLDLVFATVLLFLKLLIIIHHRLLPPLPIFNGCSCSHSTPGLGPFSTAKISCHCLISKSTGSTCSHPTCCCKCPSLHFPPLKPCKVVGFSLDFLRPVGRHRLLTFAGLSVL